MSTLSNFVPPSKPPKYFAIDVDGTFHAHDAAAFAKNLMAFRKLVESGKQPFFCTGRPLFSAIDVLDDLYTDGVYRGYPGVYQNGAVVFNERAELISKTLFSESFVRNLCDAVEAHGLQDIVVFFSDTDAYSLVPKSHCWDRLVKIWNLNAELKVASVDEILKAGVVQVMTSQLPSLKAHLSGVEGVDYIVKCGACGIGDINPPGTTKAVGLRTLLGQYNTDPMDCCYIGDGSNDIEAMQQADWSFAVGNASDDVKSKAKYVVEETYNQAAFAKVVSLVYGIDV
uniref:Putative had superfamily hydrolase n=1 Tax=Amblyomma aureolatum TaxID=187763 RepID=A0A1E1XGY1_9ACAR